MLRAGPRRRAEPSVSPPGPDAAAHSSAAQERTAQRPQARCAPVIRRRRPLQDARLPLRGDRVGFYKAGGASGDSFCGCQGFTQSPQVVSLDNSTPDCGGVG